MAELKLRNVRLSFPDLAEAVQYQGQGPFNFRASFLVEPDSASDKAIRTMIQQVAAAAWPKTHQKEVQAILANPMKTAYTSGNLKSYDGYEGRMVLAASRKQADGRPIVVDSRNHQVQPGEPEYPYAGCYVNAAVDIWAQDNAYGKGIRCTLIGVMFAAEGEAFSGVRPASPGTFDDMTTRDEDSLV